MATSPMLSPRRYQTAKTNAAEAKKVLKMARDNFAETPEERRAFRSAVGLAERQFELPVPVPEDEG